MPDSKQESSFKTQKKSHCHRKKERKEKKPKHVSKQMQNRIQEQDILTIRESTQLIHQLNKVSLQS